ncbi:TRM11 family SAM-dependent methyltransferase [Paenibacillus sp. KN14-4R]|uniref:TRM11 family SAM-dependent methyltransferase n=1 Tax=Paenibacillus sp. KN14-4R TaxID=3445773 RepID=UPI003F9EE059
MSLCMLEMKTLFGHVPHNSCIESPFAVNPSRSPFIKLELAVRYGGQNIREIADQVESLQTGGKTFKIIYIESNYAITYDEERAIEREIGSRVHGKADMRKPERIFGIIHAGGRWLFGEYRKNEAVWLRHTKKPHNYSTALSTRVARAIVNIAVPHTDGVTVIDPCCGIGTVVIEALSMGISIVGSDLNPLAIRGARANLAHFNMPQVVEIQDMTTLTGHYDVAILDMPYNLCSVLSDCERSGLLKSIRSLASKVVIITIEQMDDAIMQAGLSIIDRCVVSKGRFARQVIVCR